MDQEKAKYAQQDLTLLEPKRQASHRSITWVAVRLIVSPCRHNVGYVMERIGVDNKGWRWPARQFVDQEKGKYAQQDLNLRPTD